MFDKIKEALKELKQRNEELKKIDEMERNNVVIGVYYHGSLFDEYFLGSEMVAKPKWESEKNELSNFGVEAFSIDTGGCLIPIQESGYMYEQFKKYNGTTTNDSDVIAVSKKIDWEKTNSLDIDYIYSLYTNYKEYEKNHGYQKVK